MKIKGLILVRSGSTRVINKNIRPFANSNLLKIKIEQLQRISKLDGIIVNSNSDEILDMARIMGVKVVKRDDYYASNSVSINEVYENFAKNFDADVCVYTNATSPLIKDVTIENCIDLYLNNSKEHDSCNTVNSVKLFLWKEGKPINYDVNNKPRSQDLPEIVAINHSVNVLPRETLLKRREVVGLKPIFYIVDQMEGVDIDVDIDFQFAEFMYRKYILNEQI